MFQKEQKPLNIPFSDSKVLKSNQDKFVAQSFFNKRKRNIETQLIYLASECQFSVKQFYNKCYGVPDTVFFATTEFQKIFGGYTPLTWKGKYDAEGTFQQDKSQETFMCSITNKDKLTIMPQSKYQIWHYKNSGPIFSNENLNYDIKRVCDATDYKDLYFTAPQFGYWNPRYKVNDPESWKLYSGINIEQNYFRVVEWQAFKLNF